MNGIRKSAKALLIVSLMFSGILPLFPDIGQDFEKAGIAVSGGVSFYYDFSYFLDPSWTSHQWYLSVYPALDFFLADALAISVEADFLVRQDSSMQYGLDGALFYSFVQDPRANTGVVPRIGVALNPFIESGVRLNENYMNLWIALAPQFQLFFFITDRISPYLSLVPRFGYWLMGSSGGAPVTYSPLDRLYLELNVFVGIAFWIPKKDEVIYKIE